MTVVYKTSLSFVPFISFVTCIIDLLISFVVLSRDTVSVDRPAMVVYEINDVRHKRKGTCSKRVKNWGENFHMRQLGELSPYKKGVCTFSDLLGLKKKGWNLFTLG